MINTGEFSRLHKKIYNKSENSFVPPLQLISEREGNISTADVKFADYRSISKFTSLSAALDEC